MPPFIPYGRQSISPADISAVVEVLQSDWLTQGPMIPKFEETVCQFCGAKYGVAVSSATAGLHIACLTAGLGEGDYLWTVPNTFVASANCGLYCGAKVDFIDIDPHTYNLDVNALAEKLAIAKSRNKLPKVVIPVHFAGKSCAMEEIDRLAKEYGFTVIEDASHAIGGSYQGQPVGSCRYSAMAVFSFHPVKIIATGEGGMVLTNDPKLYAKLLRLRTHGITRDPDLMDDPRHGAWYYQQLELGFNYRLTDLQAALGISQMQRIDDFIRRRRQVVDHYGQLLKNLPLSLPSQDSESQSSWHLYVVRLELAKLGKTRRQIFDHLRSLGIGVNVHYIPVHTQPYYQKLGFGWGDFPQAEDYYHSALSLPIHYELTDSDIDRVVRGLQSALG